jgi:hypothetical protein
MVGWPISISFFYFFQKTMKEKAGNSFSVFWGTPLEKSTPAYNIIQDIRGSDDNRLRGDARHPGVPAWRGRNRDSANQSHPERFFK